MLRVLVLPALAVLISLVAAPAGIRSSSASTRLGADYGLYCLRGRLIIDRRDIEELKNLYKADICRLDEDPCASGIREKIQRLGGPEAACDCD